MATKREPFVAHVPVTIGGEVVEHPCCNPHCNGEWGASCYHCHRTDHVCGQPNPIDGLETDGFGLPIHTVLAHPTTLTDNERKWLDAKITAATTSPCPSPIDLWTGAQYSSHGAPPGAYGMSVAPVALFLTSTSPTRIGQPKAVLFCLDCLLFKDEMTFYAAYEKCRCAKPRTTNAEVGNFILGMRREFEKLKNMGAQHKVDAIRTAARFVREYSPEAADVLETYGVDW